MPGTSPRSREPLPPPQLPWWGVVLAAMAMGAVSGTLALIVLHAGRAQGIW